jgi:hypothetical protein
MAVDVEIRKIIRFETAADGTAVKLLFEDAVGVTVGIILSIETLTALLMTLPDMASRAVQRAKNDPKMRVTFPLGEFQIELGPDNLRILTLGTADGFKVSFSLTKELSLELGRAHLGGTGYGIRVH